MKKVTLLLIALIITSVGIVVAKISSSETPRLQKTEKTNPQLIINESDVTSWD